jgi:hypothetical protein
MRSKGARSDLSASKYILHLTANLNRAGILLTVTLALPLALAILTLVSRLTGSTDAVFALFLFCTVAVYVSFAAGVLVPIGIGVARLFGTKVSSRTIAVLLLLSLLNVAVALTWIALIVPQMHFRW